MGFVASLAKKAGVESVGLAGWMKVDTSRMGEPDGPTKLSR